MGQLRKDLLLELPPICSGNHGNFDDVEEPVQQSAHLRVAGRFPFGQRAIQIEHDELFHRLAGLPE